MKKYNKKNSQGYDLSNAAFKLFEFVQKKKAYVTVLSCLVVFITTYLLILPALALDKDKAEADAADLRAQYDKLTAELTDVRTSKSDLLKNANLPLPDLSVEEGELIYKGQKWDNMSGSDQLKVSTAIVRQLKPDCGFILLDKLEQMDLGSLEEFGKWLEQEGLQAIATRVSTGEECSIIIEDGYVVGQDLTETNQNENEVVQVAAPPGTVTNQSQIWKEGKF